MKILIKYFVGGFMMVSLQLISYQSQSFGADMSPLAKPGAQPCEGTFSGAVTLSFKCFLTSAFDIKKNQTFVGFQVDGALDNIKQMSIGSTFQGELSLTQYEGDKFLTYSDLVMTNDMHYFLAQNTKYPSTHKLSLTSLETSFSTEKNKMYLVHGTYDAVLNSVYPPGSAPLNVHVTF